MLRKFQSAARWLAAAVLVLLSIAGAMLPFIPGFVFFALAVAVVASESHLVRKWLRWVKRRFPRALSRMRVPLGPSPTARRAASRRNEPPDDAG